MIQYRLNRLGVKVEIDAALPDQRGPVVVRSIGPDEGMVDFVRKLLSQQIGLYGHIFHLSFASPIDLSLAMASEDLLQHEPELIMGAEVLAAPREKLPAETIT
jgi:hypothetical protein